MKNMMLWGGAGLAVIMTVAIGAAFHMGEKSPFYATGAIRIDSSLEQHAKGIRTLYITVFDQGSPMPMPYGAMRERLSEDPKGQFLEFAITKERLQIMRPNAPLPKTMRIKARLDIDGLGGTDQPDDLTGEVRDVAFGTEQVEVMINTKI